MIETHVGIKGLGCLPDINAREDQPFSLALAPLALPDVSKDWTLAPNTSDQGSIGSCAGHAVIDSTEDVYRDDGETVELSALWAYLGGRLLLNHLTLADYVRDPYAVHPKMTADTGSMIRDVVSFINREGVMWSAIWPQDNARFADLPPGWARKQAQRSKRISMRYLDSAEEVRVAIHQGEKPILGFVVYASFSEVGLDGNYRIPSGGTRGAHAVRAVKHDKNKIVPGFRPGAVLLRNSWGAQWGMAHPTMAASIPGKGFFWMPDEIIDSRDVSDIWVVKKA